MLRASEDQGVVHITSLEELDEQASLERSGHGVERLSYAFRRRGFALERDLDWVLQDLPGQLFDLRRHGRAEEEGLLHGRDVLQDTPDVGQEAHIEHAICFIEDQVLQAGQLGVGILEVIEEPAGRGDDDVGALSEGSLLRPHADSAVNGLGFQLRVPREVLNVIDDLERQFPRRSQDERARRASRSVHQLVENGEYEGGGLTAAGRCAGEKVTSLKRGWDRLCLNGGGACEAEIVDTAKKLRVER